MSEVMERIVGALVRLIATTLHDVDTRVADSATPPGTVGLAKLHKPLDVAPGQQSRHCHRPPASSR